MVHRASIGVAQQTLTAFTIFTRPQAWAEAPLDALQLSAHLRDVRDGKGERERFHDAAAWLAARHPRTLVANLGGIAHVCCRHASGSVIAASRPLKWQLPHFSAGYG